MSHPSKRRATRSPSPQLPLHYLDTSISSSDVPHIFRIQAHEATLIHHDRLARETETTQEQGGRMADWSGSGEGSDEQVFIDRSVFAFVVYQLGVNRGTLGVFAMTSKELVTTWMEPRTERNKGETGSTNCFRFAKFSIHFRF